MAWAKRRADLQYGEQRRSVGARPYRSDFGYKIFAPPVATARLEINRSAGMAAMQAVGIDIPPYTTINSLEDAEAFARKSYGAWVFKPMRDEDDKSLTYVSHSPAGLVGWLRRQIKAGEKLEGRRCPRAPGGDRRLGLDREVLFAMSGMCVSSTNH